MPYFLQDFLPFFTLVVNLFHRSYKTHTKQVLKCCHGSMQLWFFFTFSYNSKVVMLKKSSGECGDYSTSWKMGVYNFYL